MNKEWVLEQQNNANIMKDEMQKEIREALGKLEILDDDDIESFLSQISESICLGFNTPVFMWPDKVYLKYKDLYFNSHDDKATAVLALEAFRFKVDEVLKQIDFHKLMELEHTNYSRYIDSEPTYFDGDIIITDPCYVLKHDDWNGYEENFEHIGIKQSMARDTLYGDWSCTTYNSDTGEVLGEFCADAGMVSVLSLDEILRYNPKFDYHTTKPWTTTLIRDFKGSVQFVIKESKWTLDEDTSYGKAGDEFTDYYVEVVGKGINKKTGEQLNFVGKQTGL